MELAGGSEGERGCRGLDMRLHVVVDIERVCSTHSGWDQGA